MTTVENVKSSCTLNHLDRMTTVENVISSCTFNQLCFQLPSAISAICDNCHLSYLPSAISAICPICHLSHLPSVISDLGLVTEVVGKFFDGFLGITEQNFVDCQSKSSEEFVGRPLVGNLHFLYHIETLIELGKEKGGMFVVSFGGKGDGGGGKGSGGGRDGCY